MPTLVERRPDYSSVIRSEIERDVVGLIERVGHQLDYWKSLDCEPVRGYASVTPTHIELGYTINMHQGRDLFLEGDIMAGLPIHICREATRTITVVVEEVEMETEEGHGDDDPDYEGAGYHKVYDMKDLSQSVTW